MPDRYDSMGFKSEYGIWVRAVDYDELLQAARRVSETVGFTLNVPGLADGVRVFDGPAERKAAAEALRDLRDVLALPCHSKGDSQR